MYRSVRWCTLLLNVETRDYKVAELIAEGGRIEAPKGVGCGKGVSPPHGEVLGRGLCPLPRKIVGILHIKCCNLVHIHRCFTSIVTEFALLLYHCAHTGWLKKVSYIL